MGGRCRLQGLRTAPELNGQIGRIIGWNADGRRRYGVQLDSGQKISCQVRNAVAFDPPQWAFPHDFDCTSAELVGKLQARLREVGSERVVLDWTPLVAAVADTVFLLHVAHDMGLIADLWASVAMHDALAQAGASAGNRNGAKRRKCCFGCARGCENRPDQNDQSAQNRWATRARYFRSNF